MKTALAAIALLLLPFALRAAEPVNAAPQVKLSFSAATKFTNGTDFPVGAVVRYHVFGALKGAEKFLVGSPITATNTTISVGLEMGKTYCYVVYTEVNGSGIFSAASNEACKSFDQPASVTITIT